ncbi:MAG TPA: amidohydrolase family protein, partial [Patescibacteria group bacterium]|nr:amidohydrolase family protein [Patescibacteria group bacterium]
MQKIYLAHIFNPLENKAFVFFKNGALVVENEKILFCGESEYALKTFANAEIHDFKNDIIIPGLVDTHVHLPQFQATALGKGELLEWLQNYIFPLESRFKNNDFAREQSGLFFKELARNGTTSAAVYSTSHFSATDIAFESALDSGLRICLGNSVMERNSIPELDLSAEKNLHNCELLATKWHNTDNGRLRYVVTPRFAGSCSFGLLKKLGEFARVHNLPIQTHLSENLKEIEFILKEFPAFNTYTEIYEKAGLLTDKTILAHSIYLDSSEENLVQTHNCAIAHCPTSNHFLSSGIMPLKKYVRKSFKI